MVLTSSLSKFARSHIHIKIVWCGSTLSWPCWNGRGEAADHWCAGAYLRIFDCVCCSILWHLYITYSFPHTHTHHRCIYLYILSDPLLVCSMHRWAWSLVDCGYIPVNQR